MADLKKERTLVIIKPDGVQRSLIGEIIRRIERTGLKFVAFKFLVATEDQCWEHYHKEEAWFLEKGNRITQDRKNQNLPIEKEPLEYGKDIIQSNVDLFTSGPVLAMVVEGNGAVGITKKLIGATEPTTSDVGTIRGDYTLDSYELSSIDNRAVRNLVHCSDSTEEAGREIKIWFDDKDIIKYRLVADQILYDVNLDGILE
ncbi:MAG: nucleoside-diphosphate kinase [Parcubacteria group bacterium]|nr:nucleoside-diphosphate kinase [Parcubacteria group bacterium]|tara:strand:+ start:14517 stop:15119 length:603 start_codon:yes stop_codon:yes gene_type:complete